MLVIFHSKNSSLCDAQIPPDLKTVTLKEWGFYLATLQLQLNFDFNMEMQKESGKSK